MINRQVESQSLMAQPQELMIESTVFEYKKYEKTIFVPVYPRAHVQEVIRIDQDRRTVTARFTIHLTICLKGQEGELKKFIRNHLILEFGYNQIIYIPELMMRDNPPYIIQEVIEPSKSEEYVTYKIKGNIECSANFDFLLFPYRQIEVINHLVIRSQEYKGQIIKYNAMMLLDYNCNFHQFSPHIVYPQFAGYTIINESAEIFTGESKYSIKQKFKNQNMVAYLFDFITRSKYKMEAKEHFSPEDITKMIFDMSNRALLEDRDDSRFQDMNELCPFKHVTFKFDMASDKIAFVFQNQVPIWILGVVSLYLFTSKPDMGNRFGNAILIIVSMIALLTNFRLNNIQHHSLTLYEFKIMGVMAVPVLLIISTTVDFYSNSDPTLTYFALRTSQIQNPFMLASIIIYTTFYLISLIFFSYIMLKNCWERVNVPEKLKRQKYDAGFLWQNLQDLKWGQPGLFKKLADLMVKNGDVVEIKQKRKQQLLKSEFQRQKKTMKSFPSNQKRGFALGQSIVSQFDSTSQLPRNPN